MEKTTSAVIRDLKPIFARHGVPDMLIADDKSFDSLEITEFSKMWNFKMVASSPKYPKSNGQEERFVKIMKDILKKEEDPTPQQKHANYWSGIFSCTNTNRTITQ